MLWIDPALSEHFINLYSTFDEVTGTIPYIASLSVPCKKFIYYYYLTLYIAYIYIYI